MDIGQLNRLVTILARGTGRDAAGQPVGVWTVFAQPWANVRHKSGAETMRADHPVSTVQVSIRVRYRTDLTADMRVQDADAIYEIKAVLPDQVRKAHTDLVCELLDAAR